MEGSSVLPMGKTDGDPSEPVEGYLGKLGCILGQFWYVNLYSKD